MPLDLELYLARGIKVILFSDSEQGLESLESYRKANMLFVFVLSPSNVSLYATLFIIDGRIGSFAQRRQLKRITTLCKFNLEQYLVEHAPAQMHLNVKAGAGTGKTTVMIQRILFILHTTNVPLQEMAMITFTREASHRMFQKLREEFYKRYQATTAVKYLRYIEELPKMQISTIHSFARKLVKNLGAIVGYGSNVRIKSFKMERQQIIEKHINLWMESEGDPDNILERFNGMMLYKIVNTANSYWEEMEKKGLTEHEIRHLEWGNAGGDSESLHKLFSSIFPACEADLQQLKYDMNAISLNDLTRQLDSITNNQKSLFQNANPISYLFVDEFQDTDDIQIKLAARLVDAYKLRLFVVGDIKQSIYRFRGAKYTAFDILRGQLGALDQSLKNYSLTTNYRSSVELLEKMHPHFGAWGEEGLLPYGNKDRLQGVKPSHNPDHYRIERPSFERFSQLQEEYTIRFIREAKSSLTDPAQHKIAVLVRTNNQAMYLRTWCERAGIHVQLNIGGTFYLSQAAKDFYALVRGLLFSNQPSSLLNMLNSPYSSIRIDWTVLPRLEGDESRLLEFITNLDAYRTWQGYLEDLRISPVLAVLRRIVEEADPVGNHYSLELEQLNRKYPDQDNEAESRARALQYQLNLNHLFELIHRQFSSEFMTLYSLHQWLQLQMAVNRDEDEPQLEEEEQADRVQIMTVHKSKGLEFHTVIVPFTDRVFRYAQSELLLEKRGHEWHAGWFIRKGDQQYGSSVHQGLQNMEEDEAAKEETRLLYVAITRAESRLWVVANRARTFKNWYTLLSKRGSYANA
ncbi:UvrD-helicase domain-containing protein [Cohnella luojiensis]|nr:ATP-dependent helicase [Cohnella luojiensis]